MHICLYCEIIIIIIIIIRDLWKPLLNVPSGCDGCGAPFSLDHTLVCRKGGLIIQRHNEVWDAVGDLAALVWGRVVSEPVVRDA